MPKICIIRSATIAPVAPAALSIMFWLDWLSDGSVTDQVAQARLEIGRQQEKGYPSGQLVAAAKNGILLLVDR